MRYSILIIFICTFLVSYSIKASSKQTSKSKHSQALIKAKFSPLQIGITDKISLVNSKAYIYGISIGLPLAYNRRVYGIGTGFAGANAYNYGIQMYLCNLGGNTNGIQTGLISLQTRRCNGLQANLFWNQGRCLYGVQVGCKNNCMSLHGGQIGLINSCSIPISKAAIHGFHKMEHGVMFQVGVSNYTAKIGGINPNDDTYQFGIRNTSQAGFQFGIYNKSKESFLQIGLLNHNEKGFLPYFPFFNFSVE